MFKIEVSNKNYRVSLAKKTVQIFDIESQIRKDKVLFEAYQANITMSFVDHAYHWKKFNKKCYLSGSDIQKIANDAAKNFLNMWLNR